MKDFVGCKVVFFLNCFLFHLYWRKCVVLLWFIELVHNHENQLNELLLTNALPWWEAACRNKRLPLQKNRAQDFCSIQPYQRLLTIRDMFHVAVVVHDGSFAVPSMSSIQIPFCMTRTAVGSPFKSGCLGFNCPCSWLQTCIVNVMYKVHALNLMCRLDLNSKLFRRRTSSPGSTAVEQDLCMTTDNMHTLLIALPLNEIWPGVYNYIKATYNIQLIMEKATRHLLLMHRLW
jgi:hypothetical protein